MRLLPWRRKKPDLFDENPWDEDVGLSDWTPGLSDRLDLLAMMASMAKAQWTLGAWLARVSRAQTFMSRCFTIAAVAWVVVAVVNLNYLYHWW